jgi:hypothetical protein
MPLFIILILAILPRPIPTSTTKVQALAEIAHLDGLIVTKDATVATLTAQVSSTQAALATANTAIASLTADLAAQESVRVQLMADLSDCDLELESCVQAGDTNEAVVAALQGLFDAGAQAGIVVPDAVLP